MRHTFAQHLLSEVGACIYDETLCAHLNHCRGSQTHISRIGRAANGAVATYDWHTLRSARTEKS
jgi:hypothetical protein